MHPDDVPRIQAQLGDAVARSAAQGGAAVPFVFERRMRLPGNTFAMIHSSGCVEVRTGVMSRSVKVIKVAD